MKRYTAAQLDELPAVPCPCGTARRAFAELASPLLSRATSAHK